MTNDEKLMQQALDAMQFGLHVGFDESSENQIKKGGKAFDHHSKAITALRERLAQPEQEPIITKDGEGMLLHGGWHSLPDGAKLYTTPPQRKPLTDEEISAIDWKSNETLHDFARAIERAHGITGETK